MIWHVLARADRQPTSPKSPPISTIYANADSDTPWIAWVSALIYPHPWLVSLVIPHSLFTYANHWNDTLPWSIRNWMQVGFVSLRSALMLNDNQCASFAFLNTTSTLLILKPKNSKNLLRTTHLLLGVRRLNTAETNRLILLLHYPETLSTFCLYRFRLISSPMTNRSDVTFTVIFMSKRNVGSACARSSTFRH